MCVTVRCIYFVTVLLNFETVLSVVFNSYIHETISVSDEIIVVVVVWLSELQSVPITTTVASSNPAHGKLYVARVRGFKWDLFCSIFSSLCSVFLWALLRILLTPLVSSNSS